MKALYKRMVKEANERKFCESSGRIAKAQSHQNKLLSLAGKFADKAQAKGFNWLAARDEAYLRAFNEATGRKMFGQAGGSFVTR